MGYRSRSQASALVRAGRVTCNGRVVRDPETPVRIGRDRLAVDGSRVEQPASVYLVMNKPRGLVTSAADEHNRPTVYDLLEKGGPWVSPVGRLDKASEGLLLLTNDSDWAAKITDPASHLDKRYHVQVDCIAGDELLARISQGVTVAREYLRVKEVGILRQGGKNSWLEVTLDEGKNRHIRRLLAALGVEVLRLVRVAVGPLELGDLRKGEVRRLTNEEKLRLDHALAGTRSSPKHNRRVPIDVG